MPAYFVFDNQEILDAAKLEEYVRRVAPIVAAHGGRYLVRAGAVEAVEGTAPLRQPVIIEFPTADDARRWYTSEAYAPVKALRLEALRVNGALIEGLPPA